MLTIETGLHCKFAVEMSSCFASTSHLSLCVPMFPPDVLVLLVHRCISSCRLLDEVMSGLESSMHRSSFSIIQVNSIEIPKKLIEMMHISKLVDYSKEVIKILKVCANVSQGFGTHHNQP